MKKTLKILFFRIIYLINIIIFLPFFLIFLGINIFKKVRFIEVDYFLGAGVELKIYICRKSRNLYKNEITASIRFIGHN